MNENEKPVIGTSEAAVLTVVELIARAAQMSEQHMAYWLNLYYQVRSRHEAEKGATADDCYCLLKRISDTLDAIRWTPTALGPVEETEDGPSRAPAPTEADEADKPSSGAARHLPPGEGNGEAKELPPAILKSSRVLQEAET